jgi:putative component of membrane protein insertase Oxa1/YidC/SpoIIIJ protein YidD
MRLILLYAIRLYQVAIFRCPRACRFYPTCSHYATHAIAEYGALYGVARDCPARPL